MAATTGENLRLVILGKTGAGKSHVGNVILERDYFESKASAKSVTKECQKEEVVMEGRRIQVIDTPGVIDTDRKAKEIATEILKCIHQSSPGPHAFLLVLQLTRFTEEEQNAVKALQQIFGKRVADYMIVVFNRADELEDQTIEEYVQEGTKELREVIRQCGGRYLPFYMDLKNRRQVDDLIGKVDELIKVNGDFFSNEVYEASVRESNFGFFLVQWLDKMTTRVRKMSQELRDWMCTCS